ncbi:CPBP family intramembrane glutamic endopeptidase [Actinoplanes subtropicus]|uniref:CPBP family intramembrane glutamic endopeptidase n=1 Tax=Actinoplanes subtropicus TaxID=543632 RepID=UPI0007C5AF27|nr:type II CAAX endopeptidase family protein [Actinoplanes subtropicus]
MTSTSLSRLPRWLRPAGVRMLVLLVAFFALIVIAGPIESAVAGHAVLGLLVGAVVATGGLLAYRALVGRLEQRPVDELALGDARRGVLRGFGLGILLFGVVIALIALFGGYRIAGWGSVSGTIATFGVMCGVAVTEELLFRGVLFRLIQQWANTAVALAVSGLLFGALHLFNPGATLWGALAIAVEAGVLLGAAYTVSRSLWLPIGLHLGWNFAESGLFGSTDSGSAFHGGLVVGEPHGAALISGGGFGPEASIFAILVGVVASAWLLRRASRAR